MIQVTLTPTTVDELTRLLELIEKYYEGNPTAITGEPVEVKAEAPAQTKKPKALKAAAATTDSSPNLESPSGPAPSETSAAANDSAAEVTLVEVRAKLAALSQAGKAKEVKAVLSGYGVAKLTDLPKDKYAELLANVEQL